MRVTNLPDEHLIALSRAEGSLLVDACALLVVAARSEEGSPLPKDLQALLGDLFLGLTNTDPASSDQASA